MPRCLILPFDLNKCLLGPRLKLCYSIWPIFFKSSQSFVLEHLIPVNDNNKILVILWVDLVIRSPHYEIWLKNENYMGEFYCLQCLQSQEIIDYTLDTYLNKLFKD